LIFKDAIGYIARFLPENNRVERIWKLAQVEFKKRYYNDRLGLFWALLNPIFRVMIYYTIFTLVFKRAIEGIDNYALFLFSGIIFWQAFVECSKKGMTLLQSKKYLIENVRVAKIDLFYSSTLSTVLGFLFNLGAYIIVALILGAKMSSSLLFLPVIIFNVFLIGAGLGMILSVVYIYFRDINHLLDIIFLFGFWSSGIFFKGDVFLDIFPPFMYINPFVGIIMNVRNILVYNTPLDLHLLLIDLVYGILLFLIGKAIMERYSYKAFEKL